MAHVVNTRSNYIDFRYEALKMDYFPIGSLNQFLLRPWMYLFLTDFLLAVFEIPLRLLIYH